MKCPKCGYLGFEHVERCRNCGYEFALAGSSASPTSADLRLRDTSAHDAPQLGDLALGNQPLPGGEAGDGPIRTRENRLTPRGAGELPLFPAPAPDEVVPTPPAAPRPLSVRRAAPEIRKGRVDRPVTPMLDLASQTESQARPPAGIVAPHRLVPAPDPIPMERVPMDRAEAAGVGQRLVAAVIDVVLLGAIDALVIYFTLRICGLSVADVGRLPKLPLAAFLALQNLAYLVAFTAGGQTLGKMATGIRVVADSPGTSLDLGRAMLRSAIWALLALPAGLGFLTAWLAGDHRGLHDRCAGTRVVRAGA